MLGTSKVDIQDFVSMEIGAKGKTAERLIFLNPIGVGMKTLMVALAMLLFSVACERAVNLKVNGHASEYLEARITKSGDAWKVSTDLPLGNWQVRLQTDPMPVQIEPAGSHSVAWWRIPGERMQQDRPFVLELAKEGSQEVVMVMELRPLYPGQKYVEGVLKVVHWLTRPGMRFRQGRDA